jgi:hypothetical protein
VGYIRTNSGSFYIEPLHEETPEENGEHLHVVYKRSLNHRESVDMTCGVNSGII